jgi:hypothetical protein
MLSRRFSHTVALALIVALLIALLPVLPGAEAAGGVINYGQAVTGQITPADYFQLWQFTGHRGDRVRISMSSADGLDSYLGLVEEATSTVLIEDDDSGGGSDALIETTLPSDGTFVIAATRYDFENGTSQGTYQLELAGGPGPQNPNENVAPDPSNAEPQEMRYGVYYMGDMQLGEPINGSILSSSFAHLYTINLQAGTDLAIVMMADASMLDSYLIFADADGNVLAEDDDGFADETGLGDALIRLTVPQSGQYYIVATRPGIDAGKSTGFYMLLAGVPEEEDQPDQDQDGGDDGLPPGMEFMGNIAFGGSASGAITNETFVHMYRFEGQAGQTITATMRSTDALDCYLAILDANAEVLIEDDDSGGGTDAQITFRLPETGPYLLVVTRNGIDNGMSTGNYTLELIDGMPPADDDAAQQGASGFSGLPGRAVVTDSGTAFLTGFGASKNPEKASDLERYLDQGEALPGRSQIKDDGYSFQLNGNGASKSADKMSPLEAYLNGVALTDRAGLAARSWWVNDLLWGLN